MNNYEFCVHWILDQQSEKTARVLDYGCGAGRIVKELRKHNVNACGCDIFYEGGGGDYSKSVDLGFVDKGVIRKMDGNTIPFDDASFDFIVNNQVMEHVENLDGVLAEIQRVLKPDGLVLSLFPDKGVWREGHCGIAFLHWFPQNSRIRVYYAAVCRMLGFGYHKGNKSIMNWSQDFCGWLDKWTYYRTKPALHSVYSKYFNDIKHIEDYWLRQRLGWRGYFIIWLPKPVQKLVVNKLGGMVFVARNSR